VIEMRRNIHYARSGGVSIAYEVIGSGAIDLVYVPGWVSHLEYCWEEPGYARFLRRLTSFARLIIFDKRGTGLSDRAAEPPTLEQRMDDVRAVMDAADSPRAALLGVSEGGPLCALFAATYPARTAALLMYGAYARRLWAADYPWGARPGQHQVFLDAIEREWGGPVGLATRAPSVAADDRFRDWWATYLRVSASPGAALALTRMNAEIDIRNLLPAIRVPSLILHRADDRALPVGNGRYLAERIPGARYVELPGADHLWWVGDQDALLSAIERFLTGAPAAPEPDRVLATVLATEIADATETAARLGEQRWGETLESYGALVRDALARFRGRAIRATGPGVVATFDGPTRAIRCAVAIGESAGARRLPTRSGLHTGECEVTGGEVGGVGVAIAARVMARARPGEVLASGAVTDLVAGSGIAFAERGAETFAGLPGRWRLFRVEHGARPAAHAAGPDRPAGRLSPREQEVTALVARGQSNRQIGEELSISAATVERHVANICNKLGYHSRTQIAAWAVARGLAREPGG
jgi:pimeloyl-ACP methyl ester carboxylesterase/DNA-binding CsgD family transcriptional regulator